MATTGSTRLLSGFGRAGSSAATYLDVDETHLAAAVKDLPARGGIARGLGRSYGDPATNAGGHVLRLASRPDDIVLDPAEATVTVGAGVSLDDLMRFLVPRGWFVPVSPGTRFVTVGGAIASDIHGKNHHVDGSFGNYVTRLRMMLADTTIVEVGPDREPDLFWATVAGMGLTGIVLDATIRLLPIETSRISVDTYRLPDLDEVMSRMVESEADFRYSVAWIDLLASGRHLGRGVLTNGDHARAAALPAGADPFEYHAEQLVEVPPLVPPVGVINRLSVAAFNELWYRKAPRAREGELQGIPTYFHPLDRIGGWNRLYGRRGFVQYQFVVPDDAVDVLRTIIARLSAGRLPIFLVVLKRFGRGNPAPLSFPTQGWQLAIDVGASQDGLSELLGRFDRMVLDAGGRHYLAKDFHTTPDAIRRGYPRLDDWMAVRSSVDPTGVWASDLSRRLRLTP